MPIRVTCPSCQRSGRVPDSAIGKNIQCPACGNRRRLSASEGLREASDPSDLQSSSVRKKTVAEILVPDGLELIEDDPPPTARRRPSSASRNSSKDQVVPEGLELIEDDRPPDPDGLEILEDDPLPDCESAGAVPTVDKRGTSGRPPAAIAKEVTTRDPDDPHPINLVVGLGIGLGAFAATSLLVGFVLWVQKPARDGNQAGGDAQAPPSRDAVTVEQRPLIRKEPVAVTDQAESAQGPAAPGTLPGARQGLARRADVKAPVPATNPEPAAASPPDSEPDFAAEARAAIASPPPAPPDPSAASAPSDSIALAPSPPGILSTAEIVARYEPSIALIKGKLGSGTGFLVAPRLLATNSHVIDDEFIQNIEVRFPSADAAHKGPVRVELLYEDRKRDLAFLAVNTTLPPLKVAASYQYRKGEDVTVIGNPGVDGDTVLENAISRGVMSTKAELEGQKYYQLGIAVNPGNSGGPVFGPNGQVIGVVTLRIPGKEELSFCIPVEELRDALAKLGAQTKTDADQIRSQHRTKVAFKNLSSGGALYGLGLELHLVARTNAHDKEIAERSQKLDQGLSELETSLFFGLESEGRSVRNDPKLAAATRRKLGDLADSYQRLKECYKSNRTTVAIDTIRGLKASHRQLVSEVGKLLNVEVPEGLVALLDDHVTTATAVATVIPVAPGGSLRSQIWERHGLTPPGGMRGRLQRPTPGRSIPARPRGRFGR